MQVEWEAKATTVMRINGPSERATELSKVVTDGKKTRQIPELLSSEDSKLEKRGKE